MPAGAWSSRLKSEAAEEECLHETHPHSQKSFFMLPSLNVSCILSWREVNDLGSFVR